MPANSYKIYPKRDLVSIQWKGEPSIQDWYDVIERILGNPKYRRGMNFITSRGGPNGVTTDYVREVLNVLERRAGRMTPTSLAIVAPRPSDFGMARMMEILSETGAIVVRAFMRPRDAVIWLKDPVRYEHRSGMVFA